MSDLTVRINGRMYTRYTDGCDQQGNVFPTPIEIGDIALERQSGDIYQKVGEAKKDWQLVQKNSANTRKKSKRLPSCR